MLPVATKTELENHRELHEHAHQLTRYCRRHGGEVEVIGAAPLNTKPRTYNPGPGQNIWTVTRLEDDPLVRRGEMAIPKNQYENLERINEAGVEFTELLIAHELLPNAIATSRNGGWRDLNSYDLSVLEHNARVPAPLPAVRETRRIGDQISTSPGEPLTVFLSSPGRVIRLAGRLGRLVSVRLQEWRRRLLLLIRSSSAPPRYLVIRMRVSQQRITCWLAGTGSRSCDSMN